MSFILRLVNGLLALAQGLLLVRFALKLFAVGSSNALVAWVYKITKILRTPFEGIFPDLMIRNWAPVIELTTLLAIVVYALIHFIIGRVIRASEG